MRKTAILTAIFLVSAFATQVTLFAHLLCEKEHQGHDSQKCATCQQLMSSTKNLFVEEQTTICKTTVFQSRLSIHTEIISSISIHRISNPRAPPVVF